MNAPVSARVPPKFVPTLTEVVHVEAPAPVPEAEVPVKSTSQTSGESMLYSEFSGQSAGSSASDQPQAIADDIVFAPSAPHPWADPEPEPLPSEIAQPIPAPASTPASIYDLSPDLQEQIVHRVMQRVDLSLEMRLRDAVESVMLDHTRNLVPRLREEIEWVVRQSVAEAMAAELERGI